LCGDMLSGPHCMVLTAWYSLHGTRDKVFLRSILHGIRCMVPATILHTV